MAGRAIVAEVVRRTDAAIAVEAQAVREVIARRSRPRPTVAEITDIHETSIFGVATTRSRIPDGRSTAELAGEVHTLVGTTVGVVKI